VAKSKKVSGKKAAAARPATASPPPAKRKSAGGAALEWTQHGEDTWLAPDPAGAAAGGRIKMNAQGWMGKSHPVYFVYRDSDYLGSDPTLEAAQRRCQWREASARVTLERGGGAPRAPEAPPAPPAKPTKKEAAAAKAAASTRASLAAERDEAQAARTNAKRAAVFADDGVIQVKVRENPRKAGSGAHARFALLMSHDGKTVAQYKAADGNLETLENAVRDGRASVTGEVQ
jgi:hypothetical protein